MLNNVNFCDIFINTIIQHKGKESMSGLGTAVNAVAVIVGGLIGTLFGKKISENIRESMMKASGVAVIFIGISGTLSGLLNINTPTENASDKTLMMIISLILGTFIGELLKIESRLDTFGAFLKKKTNSENDSGFVSAFVNTSLIVCVGAMAIVGAIEDGINGNHSTLFAKSLLDFIIVITMSSTLGNGCIFSFIPIVLLQGSVTALSYFSQSLLNVGTVIADMSTVGNVLIFCVGINICFGKKFKVGNMLPSLVIAVIYSAIDYYLR